MWFQELFTTGYYRGHASAVGVRRCLEGREKVKTKLKLMEEEIRKVPPSRVMKTRARV